MHNKQTHRQRINRFWSYFRSTVVWGEVFLHVSIASYKYMFGLSGFHGNKMPLISKNDLITQKGNENYTNV